MTTPGGVIGTAFLRAEMFDGTFAPSSLLLPWSDGQPGDASSLGRGDMIDDMGIFRTTIAIATLARPEDARELAGVMVDTGSEYNWIPRGVLTELGIPVQRIDRFETADGRVLEREVGFAMLFAGGRATPTIVVFANAGDMVLLGALGLEGLNLRVDPGRKELVPAGPVPAAAVAAA